MSDEKLTWTCPICGQEFPADDAAAHLRDEEMPPHLRDEHPEPPGGHFDGARQARLRQAAYGPRAR